MYGEQVTKTYKTFYRPVSGLIRVVLVKEEHGWYAFYCTNPEASEVEILEAFAARATIEQDFHDIKGSVGRGTTAGPQHLDEHAVYHLNLWMHTLAELWAWNKTHEQLCDRSEDGNPLEATCNIAC